MIIIIIIVIVVVKYLKTFTKSESPKFPLYVRNVIFVLALIFVGDDEIRVDPR